MIGRINQIREAGNHYLNDLQEVFDHLPETAVKLGEASGEKFEASHVYVNGVLKYFQDFVEAYWISVEYSNQ
ncbi:MAG TPA: hypothetical protein PLA83_07755 [Deltaproteobacteria bacterium]|nr:hypothetical protein [Deltaproteobacteria bacterium]